MFKNKKTLSLVVLATGTAVFLGATAYIVSNRFRRTVNSLLKKKIKCDSNFLFIGDSNTKANFSYADQLKQSCPNANIKKIAENGKTTEWMLSELMKEYKQGKKYDVIAILGGSNDISGGRPINEITRNLNAMYEFARRMDAVVVGIAPPNKDFYDKYSEEQRNKLSELVDWLAKNTNVDYFINFYKITERKDYFLDDLLHPNQMAHRVLLQQFQQKLIA